ncbi:MAG: hypothetical protein AAFU60_10450 [Bacteroidota bacterium]
MEAKKQPLSNAQLELLKLLSRDLEEKDLKDLKRLVVRFLAEKLAMEADKVWEEKNWSPKDMDRLSETHQRTPYRPG